MGAKIKGSEPQVGWGAKIEETKIKGIENLRETKFETKVLYIEPKKM